MYKKLLLIFLLVTASLLILEYFVNTWMDPYVLSSKTGWVSNQEIRVTKPIKVFENKLKAVLIGNSRNNYGIDLIGDNTSDFYNLSLSGIGINEIAKLFYHTVSSNADLEVAFISLDSVCDPNDPLYASQFIDERFLISSKNKAHEVIFNKYALYASYSTLELSIAQSKAGFLNEVGRQTIFNENEYLSKGAAHGLRTKEAVTIGPQGNKESTQELSFQDYKKMCKTTSLISILNLAKKQNIKLTFFINPVNVRYWEITYQKNRLQTYLFDKKIIKDIIHASLIGANQAIKVIDFRRLNDFTLERLSYNDAAEIKYKYWYESSHFTKKFGDVITSILISDELENMATSVSLLDIDIEDDFKSQLNILKSWRLNNPDLVSEIQQAFVNTK
jgi:hypothetical protein